MQGELICGNEECKRGCYFLRSVEATSVLYSMYCSCQSIFITKEKKEKALTRRVAKVGRNRPIRIETIFFLLSCTEKAPKIKIFRGKNMNRKLGKESNLTFLPRYLILLLEINFC